MQVTNSRENGNQEKPELAVAIIITNSVMNFESENSVWFMFVVEKEKEILYQSSAFLKSNDKVLCNEFVIIIINNLCNDSECVV